MEKGTIKLISFLLTIGVVFGAYMLMPWWHSRQVRTAVYERYAELGQPELVREIVDQNHDELFDQCYKAGGGRSKANFDAEKYAKLMDRKMEDIMERMVTRAAAEAVRKQPATAPASPRQAPPAPVATGAVAAAPAVDQADRRNGILNLAARHTEYGAGGHEFLVEVDVSHSVSRRSDAIRLSVQCQGGGQFTQNSPEVTPRRLDETPPSEGWRTTFRVVVPDEVIGASGGICELEVAARDGSGGFGAAEKIFIVAL